MHKKQAPQIIFEDNHLIVVNKRIAELVQSDRTGDASLIDSLKKYLKVKYKKNGNVYLGAPHRIDRPTSGIVVFTKTSKSLSRISEQLRKQEVKKIYWAIVKNKPEKEADTLTNYLVRNKKQNKSYCHNKQVDDSKKAILHYQTIASSDNYFLLEVILETGRHHQIRSQLANIGCPIKGDLKYGFSRSNKDGGINLHARKITFMHPVKKEEMSLTAKLPNEPIWNIFENIVSGI